MDLLPGYRCAAHFMIVADGPLDSMSDYHAGGGAMQRLWLTATKLGLQFQPELTPLIFSQYANAGDVFSGNASAVERASAVEKDLVHLFGDDCVEKAVFMGRVGYGKTPASRSVRKSVAALSVKESKADPEGDKKVTRFPGRAA